MNLVEVADRDRVRTLTLDRPEVLNAFNEALYDETTGCLRAAASDPEVAVVLLTGRGRAFSAGTDLAEMAERTTNPDSRLSAESEGRAGRREARTEFVSGEHGFLGLVDALVEFPKPLVLAVNGLGLGIGCTILGFADLAFASTEAWFKCPFTSLGVAPEAASSLLFPQLVGRQHASWILLSSEWISAEEARAAGLVWRVVAPDELLAVAHEHAATLAKRPISSLIAVKETITAPQRAAIAEARQRENGWFAELMGGPANAEALRAFAEGREADFSNVPGA